MQLNLENSKADYQIRNYRPGCITINDQQYTSPILIMPSYLSAWNINDITQVTENDLLQLLELKPELILLGTGEQAKFLDLALSSVITKHKIGLEIMTSAAACRTYTILIAEQRNVLAALII